MIFLSRISSATCVNNSFFTEPAASGKKNPMSDQLPAPAASNTFERIKRVNPAGAEFWSARELARVLEYTDFRNFSAVIDQGARSVRQQRPRGLRPFR